MKSFSVMQAEMLPCLWSVDDVSSLLYSTSNNHADHNMKLLVATSTNSENNSLDDWYNRGFPSMKHMRAFSDFILS
jgi:hypothetical protein